MTDDELVAAARELLHARTQSDAEAAVARIPEPDLARFAEAVCATGAGRLRFFAGLSRLLPHTDNET